MTRAAVSIASNIAEVSKLKRLKNNVYTLLTLRFCKIILKVSTMYKPTQRGAIMQMVIKKWGNSLATRIPKAIVDSIGLHLDQEVDIEAVNGKIVITPTQEKNEYKLDDLLSLCKPGSMKFDKEDKEWLNAAPVGKEAW